MVVDWYKVDYDSQKENNFRKFRTDHSSQNIFILVCNAFDYEENTFKPV